jgi:hypothetical protein
MLAKVTFLVRISIGDILQKVQIILIFWMLTMQNFAYADALKGIKEVGILIENIDEDAIRCNISKDLLDASIRLPLANSKLKVIDIGKIPDNYLYVNINVMDFSNLCVGNIQVSLNKYVTSEEAYGQFWRKTEIMSFRKIEFSRKVGESVEAFTKQFISAWLKANQK